MIHQLRKLLTLHEGESLEAYYCPAGHLTVGIGHNCDASPVTGIVKGKWGEFAPPDVPKDQRGDVITKEKSNDLFAEDTADVWAGLDRGVPWWKDLEHPRGLVLCDMSFNMGTAGLMGFPGMLSAAQRKDWRMAVIEMHDSLWAGKGKTKPQVQRERVANLSWMMFTGEYLPWLN